MIAGVGRARGGPLLIALVITRCASSHPPAGEPDAEVAPAVAPSSPAEPVEPPPCRGFCDPSRCCPHETESGEIGDACAILTIDPQNCGRCGVRCRPGQHCEDGLCTCRRGVPCGDHCIDLDADPDNCGACGYACPPRARACRAGVCTSCATADLVDCDDDCARLQIDDRHCGGCGQACAPNSQCVAGQCVTGGCDGAAACETGTVCCDHVLSRLPGCAGCTDLRSDPFNCGGCGIECSIGKECVDGSCDCVSPWRVNCNDECVDLSSDRSNCGECGSQCDADEVCVDRRCFDCTLAGETVCDDGCARLDWDPQHCGDCDHACTGNEACNDGVCG